MADIKEHAVKAILNCAFAGIGLLLIWSLHKAKDIEVELKTEILEVHQSLIELHNDAVGREASLLARIAKLEDEVREKHGPHLPSPPEIEERIMEQRPLDYLREHKRK